MARLAFVILLGGCATLHTGLDVEAIEAKATLASKRGRVTNEPWPFHDASELEALTRPAELPAFARLPIGARHLVGELIEEQLVFISAVHVRHVESNTARLYVYRHGRLGERPVQLWVPGLYVSELALTLLRPLFLGALERGVDLIVYVPPYHLERTPLGFGSGDAVLATALSDHLAVIAQGVADLRAVVRWLRREQVSTLGVFAGSLGANLALQVARFERSDAGPAFDFFTAMIPLIDFRALILERPEFAPVRNKLAAGGASLARLEQLYAALDPSGAPCPLEPGSISVLAARYDQVTPRAPRERWQARCSVTRVREFERGHATMLLSDTLVDAALEELRHDLGDVPTR